MGVKERLSCLRKLMEEKGIDFYVIPTADFHQSEYVGEYFKARKYMTGFSGSAGTAVISKDWAGMWTDGRYFIQAAKQMEGTTVELMKMREPGVPTIEEYLEEHLPENGVIGFDGRVVSMGEGLGYETIARKKNGGIVYEYDLVDQFWENRPKLSEEPAFILEEKYAGESVADKLKRIREAMKEEGADIHILTTLDDICWTLNMRGNDIDFFPMVLSYAVITMDEMLLYIDERKLSDEMKAICKSNRVEFVGRLSDQEKKCYYYAADIFAFPSYTKAEGFGLTLAEAMYCNAVPVTYTIEGSGVNWVSLHEVTGLEVPNRNVAEYAKAIDELLSDDKKRNDFAEAAHQRIVENFTIEKEILNLKKQYKELL